MTALRQDSKFVTVQDIAKYGLSCPICKSKKFRACYHDHQIMDSYICEKCGIRWREDYPSPKKNNEKWWKEWVKQVLYYRKHKPYKAGMYKGIPAGGFVWVLHKVKDMEPVQDSRSADAEQDYKKFGKYNKTKKT